MDDRRWRAPVRQEVNEPARHHIRPYQQGWQLHDAKPLQRRCAQGRHVIGDDPWMMADGRPLAIATLQIPLIIVARRPQVETGEPVEVGGIGDGARDQFRAGDQVLISTEK